MGSSGQSERPSGRDTFEGSHSGAQNRPFIPRLRSDPSAPLPLPRSLDDFRKIEGHDEREKRLRALFKKIPHRIRGLQPSSQSSSATETPALTQEGAEKQTRIYEDELFRKCSNENEGSTTAITWEEFKQYAEKKETELWHIFHDELDLDSNGHLDAKELALALNRAGIELTPNTLSEFMTFLTSSPHSHAISFSEFRDFLLLLPRKASTEEIYRYYEVRKYMGDDGRGVARVTMEGDVSLSGEDRPPIQPHHRYLHHAHAQPELVDYPPYDDAEDEEYEEYDEEYDDELDSHHQTTSLKFLLAGGIAGAVSRTATAPFDRLRIFLITRSPEIAQGITLSNTHGATQATTKGIKAIGAAVTRIYVEGGIRSFWVGNGLSVTKIFPESAIKFFSYESAKRFFAEYVDKVDDPRDISGISRFLSGGFGGISSQLSIYPIETLKTQLMSTTGKQERNLLVAAKRLWALGGIRAYYRGLAIGLIGVFPYAAIDMSTFEALKLAYLRSTGKEEPGVLPLLMFGSISGGVGATSVYPLNLVRTRLQASGSPGHLQRYTGIIDVAQKTLEREGWRGFYRGLFPTLAKVIPSVSISYLVYEQSKKRLGL